MGEFKVGDGVGLGEVDESRSQDSKLRKAGRGSRCLIYAIPYATMSLPRP